MSNCLKFGFDKPDISIYQKRLKLLNYALKVIKET